MAAEFWRAKAGFPASMEGIRKEAFGNGSDPVSRYRSTVPAHVL